MEFTQRKNEEQDKNNKRKACVFSMIKQETEQNPNVITCILLIVDFFAYILFDYRTMYCFVLSSFMAKIVNVTSIYI